MSVRQFASEDGKTWVAKIHDGIEENLAGNGRTGWEVVEFDSGAIQRISYRPSGWLANASIQELIDALKEGESVRTTWSS